MRNKIIGLLGLALAALFVSGCRNVPTAWRTNPITNTSDLSGKSTIVVPVKGTPITLQKSQIGSALLFGVVGAAIQEGVDKPKRDALVRNIGGGSTPFSPEVVLAEECVVLLKGAGWCSGTKVTLFDGLEVMHGAGPMVEGETRVFKPTLVNSEARAWADACTKWLGDSPVHAFSATEVSSSPSLSLEVTSVNSILTGKHFSFPTLMRLIDLNSGKPLASGFFWGNFTVHPLKDTADLDAFAADYRKCARQTSETLLKQLKLLP